MTELTIIGGSDHQPQPAKPKTRQRRPSKDWCDAYRELEPDIHDLERMIRIAWIAAWDDAERLDHPEMLVNDVLDHLGDMSKKLIKKYNQLWDEARASKGGTTA